jgi:hypothetical protein
MFMKTLRNSNRRKRVKFARVPRLKSSKANKGKESLLSKAWEFVNYVIERLRALGIIQ